MKYLLYVETFPDAAPDSPRQTGIGRYCQDLAFGLAEIGHEVTVVTSENEGRTKDDAPSKYTIIREGQSTPARTNLIRRALFLTRQISRTQPDFLLLGDPLAQRVFSFIRPFSKIRYCTFFYGTDLKALSERLNYQGWSLYQFVRRAMFASHVGSAHETVVISRYTAGEFGKIAGKQHPYFILYPCVSEDFLDRPLNQPFTAEQPADLEDKEPRPVRFITVARISERKNQFGVLKVLASLEGTRGLNFHYTILGNVDGPTHQGYFAKIKAFITANSLEDAVSIVGGTTGEEKIGHIDSSDVFIMLSQTVGSSVEGFGISVIEASIREKPVIVSDQGGMRETIVEGKTGFSVPVDSDTAIGDAVMKLAGSGSLRREMGIAGREYVIANFVPKIMAARLDTHLREKSAGGNGV